MFAKMGNLSESAEKTGTAVGAFNINNLEVLQAVVAAAEKLNLSAIIQTTPKAIEYCGLSEIYAMVMAAINQAKVPLVLHLDHGNSFEIVEACLKIGYRSVMFDGSKLPFGENVSETKKVVELAKKFDAFVEGEIGVIAKGEEGERSNRQFTDPETAAEFVQQTGVDSLAISIGNTHGAPVGEKIDIELLKKINSAVEIPLVMHGSSGLSDDDLLAAIENGIRKINIDTRLKQAFRFGISEEIADKNLDIRDVLSDAREDVEVVVEKYLQIFNQERTTNISNN
ncbi:MAG: class II fructose-bisphosphate aldolase [Candidatus Berkelbacteria bacterium]|nr:class II fructose-bisphosphate aldolase [Candidatus Berkelbacteria bacterium]